MDYIDKLVKLIKKSSSEMKEITDILVEINKDLDEHDWMMKELSIDCMDSGFYHILAESKYGHQIVGLIKDNGLEDVLFPNFQEYLENLRDDYYSKERYLHKKTYDFYNNNYNFNNYT